MSNIIQCNTKCANNIHASPFELRLEPGCQTVVIFISDMVWIIPVQQGARRGTHWKVSQ